jgi:hypothetical protein
MGVALDIEHGSGGASRRLAQFDFDWSGSFPSRAASRSVMSSTCAASASTVADGSAESAEYSGAALASGYWLPGAHEPGWWPSSKLDTRTQNPNPLNAWFDDVCPF